ncbi:MAG: hypothetical protein D6696_01420 [Acidobacteria bacterium]|nr:MAG: hypothetical protein D6696_01420 [Acidobacteriota bacterium]
MMKPIDDDALHRLLDLDADGALGPGEQAELAARLAARPALAAEGRAWAGLHVLLRESRIAVRPGFARQVMEQLPAAPWENRLAGWHLPVALVTGLAAAAILLLGSARTLEHGALGTVLAVADFFQAAFLAGAGLIGASWRGAGMALEELIATSELNLWALAAGVLLINALFALLLRRPRARPAAAESDGRRRP